MSIPPALQQPEAATVLPRATASAKMEEMGGADRPWGAITASRSRGEKGDSKRRARGKKDWLRKAFDLCPAMRSRGRFADAAGPKPLIQAEEGERRHTTGLGGGQHLRFWEPRWRRVSLARRSTAYTQSRCSAPARGPPVPASDDRALLARSAFPQGRLRADIHLALTLHHCVATHPDRKEILHAYPPRTSGRLVNPP